MSIARQWHSSRNQKILRQYFGNYPLSILAIAFLVRFILRSLGVFDRKAAYNLIF